MIATQLNRSSKHGRVKSRPRSAQHTFVIISSWRDRNSSCAKRAEHPRIRTDRDPMPSSSNCVEFMKLSLCLAVNVIFFPTGRCVVRLLFLLSGVGRTRARGPRRARVRSRAHKQQRGQSGVFRALAYWSLDDDWTDFGF